MKQKICKANHKKNKAMLKKIKLNLKNKNRINSKKKKKMQWQMKDRKHRDNE